MQVSIRSSNRFSKKNLIVLSILGVGFLLSVLLTLGIKSHISDLGIKEYQTRVSDFRKIDVEDLKELSSDGSDSLVFIGLNSCSNCQVFVRKLDKVYSGSEFDRSDVHYLGFTKESTLTVEESSYLTAWMNGTRLPFFARVSDGVISELKIDKDLTLKEIEDFLVDYHYKK